MIQFQNSIDEIKVAFISLCKNKQIRLQQTLMILLLSFLALDFIKLTFNHLPIYVNHQTLIPVLAFYYIFFLIITLSNLVSTYLYLRERKQLRIIRIPTWAKIITQIIVYSFCSATFGWVEKLSESLPLRNPLSWNWSDATYFLYPIMLQHACTLPKALQQSNNLMKSHKVTRNSVQSSFCIMYIVILLTVTEFLPYFPTNTFHVLIVLVPFFLMMIVSANAFSLIQSIDQYLKIQRMEALRG